jgi:hypothetical protein
MFGNLTLASGMTLNFPSFNFALSGRGSQTVTSAGKTFTGLNIIAPGGTYQFLDPLSCGALALSNGSMDTTNQNVTCPSFNASGTATKTLTMGTATWTLTNNVLQNIWNVVNTGTTLSGASSTIVLSAVSTATRSFVGGGFTYGTITYTVANSPGALAITGANTFNNLNIGSGRVLTMPSSTINTFTQFNATGVNNGYVYLPGVAASGATVPDSAALSITGDMTIDVKAALTSWNTGAQQQLVGKSPANGNFSYQFFVSTTGTLTLQLSTDGTTLASWSSSVTTGFTAGSINWVRASTTLNNGTNMVVKFYTSSDGTAWTQLGTTVTTTTRSATFDSTGALEIGTNLGATANFGIGNYYEVRLYNSYLQNTSGTPVFDANFTSKAFGANSFTESSANAATVTINGSLAQAGDGRVLLNSSIPGTKATLTKASGTVSSCNYLTIQDSAATSATWFAGANSVNAGNNSGWIFGSAPAAGVSANFLPFFGGSF